MRVPLVNEEGMRELGRARVPTAYPLFLDELTIARFFAKIELPPLAQLVTACWTWRGVRTPRGYARFDVVLERRSSAGRPRGSARTPAGAAARRNLVAHRLMLVMVSGRDGAGLEADHTCHRGNRGCVSPFHLRWVTWEENLDARDAANGWGAYSEELSEADIDAIAESWRGWGDAMTGDEPPI